MNLRNFSRVLASCSLAAAALLVAAPAAAQADFTKVVAVGASVDAGFMDGCWVKHGQLDSWPAIFARQAGVSDFQQPLINEPGLGPCMVLQSLAPSFGYKPNTGTPANLTLPRPYDNLAVPGYLASDVVSYAPATPPAANEPSKHQLGFLTLRGLGGGTSALQQAASLHPTFFIVGVLGNELLGPATAGTVIDNVTLMPAAMYGASYKTILDTMKAAQGGTAKGIVTTIPDVTSLPYFTTVSPILGINPQNGAPIYVLGPTGCPTGYPACPVPQGTMVPLPLAQLMKLGYGVPCAIAPSLPKCDNPLPDNADPVLGIPGLLYPNEVALLRQRGADYNAQITQLANADGYKVFDTAALLADIAQHGREFAGMELTSSYLTGGIFSYDGVHPTAIGYAVVANEAVKFVNAQFGASIPQVNFYDYLFTGNSSGGYPTGMTLSREQVLDWAAEVFSGPMLQEMQSVIPPYRLMVTPGGSPAPQRDPHRRLDLE